MELLDNSLVSQMIFYPRQSPNPGDGDKSIIPLEFDVNGETLGGIFFVREKDLPTVVLFHGNGEIAADYTWSYSKYFQMGVNLVVFDFRGYGFSTGEPKYSALFKDSRELFPLFQKWLEDNNFSKYLFIQGRSLGSTCASEISSRNPEDVLGVIFECGFASVFNMTLELASLSGPLDMFAKFIHSMFRFLTPESFFSISNDTRMKKIRIPTLIVHGDADNVIPHVEATDIFDSIPEDVDKKLVIIEGAGHNDIHSFDEFYFELQEFILKNMK